MFIIVKNFLINKYLKQCQKGVNILMPHPNLDIKMASLVKRIEIIH